jgi:hypothetical protein
MSPNPTQNSDNLDFIEPFPDLPISSDPMSSDPIIEDPSHIHHVQQRSGKGKTHKVSTVLST